MRRIDTGELSSSRFPGQGATFLTDPEPEPLFCPIVSADDHVLEPVDVFSRRMPRALADAAPHVVTDDDDVPYWQIEDVRMPVVILNGAVGRPISEWDTSPQRFDEFRPGVMDLTARLADMDLCGIWASLCFPSSIWGFTGSVLSQLRDQAVGLAAVRAYNDWMLEDWCSGAPERFIACQIPWLSDPELAAEEIRRNAARGFRSVSFSENPEGKGYPSLYSGHWDPVFAACEETGTVISLHVGSSGVINQPSSDSPIDVLTVLFPVNGITAIVDWIYARIPVRYPGIRIALSESGASWVPMVIERLHRAWRQVDARLSSWERSDGDPVDYLHRNFWFTSLEDPSAFHALSLIGEDKIMVETDFPHQDSTWPDAQDMIRRELSHLAPETVAKVCYGNACHVYQHPAPPPALLATSEVGRAMRDGTPLGVQLQEV
jgi:predicted TIM-barrel fold metal-dependent hydrolase